MSGVLVVGAGLAGSRCAEALRAGGYGLPITVAGAEPVAPYERPALSKELLACDITHLAYVAKDGTPRSIPIAFTWNGSEIVLCTTKSAPKLRALRANPMVALTIDTEVHPPKRN